ncbi:hypothetical protein HZ326_11148 [Fusarium oxysporum f. sp. albedinis]|nr:hypothetical protein HZ326_11148 [Fusarium oxysporum f. sp. albedinis]
MIQRILRSVLLHDQKRICALLSYNFCFNTRTYLIQHDTRRKGHGVRTTQSKSPPHYGRVFHSYIGGGEIRSLLDDALTTQPIACVSQMASGSGNLHQIRHRECCRTSGCKPGVASLKSGKHGLLVHSFVGEYSHPLPSWTCSEVFLQG